MSDDPDPSSDIYGPLDYHQQRSMASLVFEVTYPDGRMHIFGTSHVKHMDGHPLWWAACTGCQHVDLYSGINLLRGEFCIECSDSLGISASPWTGGKLGARGLPEFDASKPRALPTRRNPRMYPMRNQEAACTALLLGGLDAVRVIAIKEHVDDQSQQSA